MISPEVMQSCSHKKLGGWTRNGIFQTLWKSLEIGWHRANSGLQSFCRGSVQWFGSSFEFPFPWLYPPLHITFSINFSNYITMGLRLKEPEELGDMSSIYNNTRNCLLSLLLLLYYYGIDSKIACSKDRLSLLSITLFILKSQLTGNITPLHRRLSKRSEIQS